MSIKRRNITKYVVVDEQGYASIGDSPQEAYNAYMDNGNDMSAQSCTFYELGREVKVELRAVQQLEIL